MTAIETTRHDFAIVGGGVAGRYAALCMGGEAMVFVLTKGPLRSSASYLAQGGVAAATVADDTPGLHAADTSRAGRGLCRESAVRTLVAAAPARVADLAELGVPFDPSALVREESRGGQYRADFPFKTETFAAHSVVGADERVIFERWL